MIIDCSFRKLFVAVIRVLCDFRIFNDVGIVDGEEFVAIILQPVDRSHHFFPCVGAEQIEPTTSFAQQFHLTFTHHIVKQVFF